MSGTLALHPVGELDIRQAARLRSEWFPEVDEREPELVIVDLSNVTFVDVTGLRIVAGLVRRQRDRGGSVAVSNASAMVLYLLQATSLSDLLDDVDALVDGDLFDLDVLDRDVLDRDVLDDEVVGGP